MVLNLNIFYWRENNTTFAAPWRKSLSVRSDESMNYVVLDGAQVDIFKF